MQFLTDEQLRTTAPMDELPFLDTDLGRATFSMTLEDFAFFVSNMPSPGKTVLSDLNTCVLTRSTGSTAQLHIFFVSAFARVFPAVGDEAYLLSYFGLVSASCVFMVGPLICILQ